MQFTNGHFKKCNEWLAERYGPDEVIDWNLTQTASSISPPASHTSHTQVYTAKTHVEKSPEGQPWKEDIKTIRTSKAAEEFEDDLDAFEALVETTASP